MKDQVRTFCRIKPYIDQGEVTPVALNMNQRVFAQTKKLSEPVKYEMLDLAEHETRKRVFRFIPNSADKTLYRWLNGSDPGLFQVDGLLGENTSQEQVFANIVEPLLGSFLEGVNTCICCYGQTGAGKTWTMSGGDTFETRGLIQRTIEQMFTIADMETNILVSYMEIYNEVIYDLLGDTSEGGVDLESFPRVIHQEDEAGTIHTRNLTLHSVSSADEATDVFLSGHMNRIVSSTMMNQASSRSHCIFTIHCESKSEQSAYVRSSKFHLVDLAGSERVWKTGLSETNLREARYINKSLHFLEQVMHALYQRKSHIPYRNSVLTSVLRESLGGNCRTVMIGNISLDSVHLRESISTCRFIERCGQIERLVEANHVIQQASPDRTSSSLPLKPFPASAGFTFASTDSRGSTLRDLQDKCGSNLSMFPKELRKALIDRIRKEGMEYRVSCVGDLCAIIQVLIAKLNQSDLEKQELRNRLNANIPIVNVDISPSLDPSET